MEDHDDTVMSDTFKSDTELFRSDSIGSPQIVEDTALRLERKQMIKVNLPGRIPKQFFYVRVSGTSGNTKSYESAKHAPDVTASLIPTAAEIVKPGTDTNLMKALWVGLAIADDPGAHLTKADPKTVEGRRPEQNGPDLADFGTIVNRSQSAVRVLVLATDYIKAKTKYFYACLPDKIGIYETRTGNSEHAYIFREYWAHLGKSSASSKATAVKLAIRTAAAEIKTTEPTGPTDQAVSDPDFTLGSTLSEPIRADGATHLTYAVRLQNSPVGKTTKRDALVSIMKLVAGCDKKLKNSATVVRAQAIFDFFQYEHEGSNETTNALIEALQVSLITNLPYTD